MSIYKEGYYAIKVITEASRRLYPDACDFGAPVRKGDNIWNWVKQLVEMYGINSTRMVAKYSTGTTVTQVVELIDEHNTRKLELFKVIYITTRNDKNWDGYVTVEKIN